MITTDIDILTARRKDVLAQIEATGPEHLYMDNWFLEDDEDVASNFALKGGFNIHACGTAACLAGHTALIMQREGISTLRLAAKGWETLDENAVAKWLGVDWEMFFPGRWNRLGIHSILEEGGYTMSSRSRACDYDIITTMLRSLINGTYVPEEGEETITA